MPLYSVPGLISIHALRKEGDRPRRTELTFLHHFYPRPPQGGRHHNNHYRDGVKPFLSTPSARRATQRPAYPAGVGRFLSTPSARRATCPLPSILATVSISIHALRKEGDATAKANALALQISIHALRKEGDVWACYGCIVAKISIHALRKEGDPEPTTNRLWNIYFYPRPPQGGRRDRRNVSYTYQHFYPRPPQGGRPGKYKIQTKEERFLSTPSARRATAYSLCKVDTVAISIHALRKEGDSKNGESIPAFDQSINQAAQNGKSCERKTFLKLEICAERQTFPGAKVPGI